MSLLPPPSGSLSVPAPYGVPLAVPAGDAQPVSTSSGEDALWRRWREAGDLQAREALAQHYAAYARALAAKCYARRVHNEFEFDEYFHFAVVGMLEALERYEPDRGAMFKTFATPRIHGAILNGLERLSERQQQIALRQRMARERLDSLKAEDEQQNAGASLLQELGDIGVAVALGFLLEGTGMLVAPEQQLPDNAYAALEMHQTRERLWQLVEQLTERESQVIWRHYRQQQPFEQIASDLKLTPGRISQLHRQGLERLHKLLKAARLDVAW